MKEIRLTLSFLHDLHLVDASLPFALTATDFRLDAGLLPGRDLHQLGVLGLERDIRT
jgi:hypothetical protein